MTRLHRFAPFGVAAVLVAGLAAPAAATTSTRTRQQQIRSERARKAAQLNALKASDADLDRAVSALQAQVEAQGARLASARQAVAAADAAVASAEAKIADTERQLNSVQSAVTGRAVAAYMRPTQSDFTEVFNAKDLGEASRKASMLQQIENNDRDLIDQLKSARQDLDLERQKAGRLKETADHRRAAVQQQFGALQQNLAEKARLEKALRGRIKEIQDEADALAAQDSAITDIIRRSQSERASRGGDAGFDGGRVSGAGLIWPAAGPVTSEFGYRWGRLHAGIDIGAGYGAPIHAAKAGVVIYSGEMSGYGNVVIVDHGGGFSTLYAHQSRIAASQGESVSQGQVIGYVGSTGHSTGPHLHFETRVNGTPENPRRYLP